MQRIRIAAAILAALMVVACNDTTAPEEMDLFNADVAVVAADGAMDGLRLMSDPNMHRGNGPFDRTRTVTWYDENDVPQDAYDPDETAWMEIRIDVVGEASRQFWTANVERHSTMVVSGMLNQETFREFNGGGTEKVVRSHHSDAFGTRTYDMTGEFSYDGVKVPVPGSEVPWPLEGTITRHLLVTITNGPNGDETRERTVIITFNGTQFATISVDGETSELDLGTRDGRFFGPMFKRMRERRERGG